MKQTPTKDQLYSALFMNLVLTFQASAMQALGKVESPMTGKTEKNLEQAKMAVDMLDMLELKTQNNLSSEEANFLTRVVSDLKMVYVQESKQNFMSRQQQHSKQVWEDFWQEKAEIEQVYSNSDRIINQLKSLGDLKGKWILEVGAGSGRDSFHLAQNGAQVITLDYAKSSLDMIKNIGEKIDHEIQGISCFNRIQ